MVDEYLRAGGSGARSHARCEGREGTLITGLCSSNGRGGEFERAADEALRAGEEATPVCRSLLSPPAPCGRREMSGERLGAIKARPPKTGAG